MTISLHKFGEFLIYCLNEKEHALSFDLPKEDNLQEIKKISSFLQKQTSTYLLVMTSQKEVGIGNDTLSRLVQIAGDSQAGIVYSDYLLKIDGGFKPCQLIDYQPGSIRDDFKFGDVFLFSTNAVNYCRSSGKR
jgi:hypothetical protein